MSPKVFITGTDTDIGKTFVSALLVKKWGFDYWKPIQTGLNEDQGDTKTVKDFLSLSGGPTEESTIFEPALNYLKPLSPWRCTVLENRPPIEINSIKIPQNSDRKNEKGIIIEGAGGLLVPIGKGTYTTDLIENLEAAVILVTRSELGTLNHTLMSLEILKQKGIKVYGVIMNGPLNTDNRNALTELGVKVLFEVPQVSNWEDALNIVPKFEQLFTKV